MKKIIFIIFITIYAKASSQSLFLLNNMILIENYNGELVFENNKPKNWLIKIINNDTITYPEKWKIKKDKNGKLITFSDLSNPKKNKKLGYYYEFEFELTNNAIIIDSIPNLKINFDFDNSPIIYGEKNKIIINEIRNNKWKLIYENKIKKIYKHISRSDYLFTNKTIKDFELILQFVYNSFKPKEYSRAILNDMTGEQIKKWVKELESDSKIEFMEFRKKAYLEIITQMTLVAMDQNTITNRKYINKKTP